MKDHNVKGTVEKAVLKELALKPNQLIKPLSEIIKKDYKSVHNAIRSLKRKGFISKGPKKTTKGGTYATYKLTQLGLAYVFTDDETDHVKAMENYENDFRMLEPFKSLSKTVRNPKLMKHVLKGVGKLHLAYGENQSPEKMFGVATTASLLINGMSPKEKEDLLKAVRRNRKLNKHLQNVAKELGV